MYASYVFANYNLHWPIRSLRTDERTEGRMDGRKGGWTNGRADS